MVLTREEVESLMDKLLALPNPFTCPHGRPTVIKMSKYGILILPRLSVNFTLNSRECNKNLTNQKIKAI